MTSTDFEKTCVEYLSKTYSSAGLSFIHSGGFDSTVPDIVVVKNGATIANIEIKEPLAQCSQFVVFPNKKNKSFYYSTDNKPSEPSEPSKAIIEEMNKDFDRYKKPSPKEMGLDTDLYYNRVIDYYLNYKGCGYFITRESVDSGAFIILPTEKLKSYFSISACYRKKRSGSHNPSIDEAKRAVALLTEKIKLIIVGTNRTTVNGKTYTDLEISNATQPLYKLEEPIRLQIKQLVARIFRLTILSFTENPNVIFSIKLFAKQNQDDLTKFEETIIK